MPIQGMEEQKEHEQALAVGELWRGIKNNDLRLINEALEKGAPVNWRFGSNSTALHLIAESEYENANEAFNNLKITEILLKAGADPNKAAPNGDMPLKDAVMYSYNPKLVEKLINYGANPYGVTIGNQNLLQYVLTSPDVNKEMRAVFSLFTLQ